MPKQPFSCFLAFLCSKYLFTLAYSAHFSYFFRRFPTIVMGTIRKPLKSWFLWVPTCLVQLNAYVYLWYKKTKNQEFLKIIFDFWHFSAIKNLKLKKLSPYSFFSSNSTIIKCSLYFCWRILSFLKLIRKYCYQKAKISRYFVKNLTKCIFSQKWSI